MFDRGRLVALVVVASLGACAAAPGPNRARPEHVGVLYSRDGGDSRDGAAPEPADRTPASLLGHTWLWTDEHGQPATFARWRGTPLVVTEIYTECTSTCPRTIAKLRKLDDALHRQRRAAEFLLVTLDPASDTPERLLRFKQVERLPAAWHLLAGTPQATRELAELLDIRVLDDGSHIVHDSRIGIFDEAGVLERTIKSSALDDEAPIR